MTPAKHSAICAEMQQLHQERQSKLLARIAVLEGEKADWVAEACALIKAADDAAADGDYMLDSNDCIKVLRGEWHGHFMNDHPVAPLSVEVKLEDAVTHYGGVYADAEIQSMAPAAPELPVWCVGSPITEEMHQAACKVLLRASGLDGTPQRMLDAMLKAAPRPAKQEPFFKFRECEDSQEVIAVIKERLAPSQTPQQFNHTAAAHAALREAQNKSVRVSNLINCGTCGYPLAPEERTTLIEKDGVMLKPTGQRKPSEAQVEAALTAACMHSTPESRKDMGRALEAAQAIQE